MCDSQVELILEGYVCQLCGTFLNENPVGYPVTCNQCSDERKKNNSDKV